MKKSILLIIIGGLLILTGCAPKLTTLYYWDDYSHALYNLKKKPTPESSQKYKESLLKIINESKKYNRQVPPGIYAEYGYFLIKNGSKNEGMKYLDLEVKTYPESSKFVTHLKEMLNR